MENKNFNFDNLITIENLNFKYNKNSINLKIDKLELPEKKIITFLGPSGSGKTTLLNLIAGFIKNKNVKVKNNLSINEIGYIMQNHSLYDNVSGKENIYVSAKNSYNWKYSKKIDFWKKFIEVLNLKNKKIILNKINKIENFIKEKKYLKIKIQLKLIEFYFLFNLNFWKNLNRYRLRYIFNKELTSIVKQLEIEKIINKKPHQLSGGEKQRIAFAKSIIKNNKFIIMDEPFSALDAKIKEQTIDWLKKIQKLYNLSIIIVTHDQTDAMKISDLILVLKDGEIQQIGNSFELYKNPQNIFVAKFIGFPEINLIHEDEKYFYYLRNSDLIVHKSDEPKWKIIDKKLIGDLWLYDVKWQNSDKRTKIAIKSNNFELNDHINLKYKNNDLLIFDKVTEKRVYINHE
ncbi:ATP-binding cassette domain-containing protein [[Mycoplasma] collis]|uniref:ATP-binding cassette domain-containing protein n=1 Tax=[Mycoplasma] collis TaxID=2127 RepID=UPI00051B327D|nr:ABC transporter ATP-binding protein [[Mycoplasma] collis]